MNNYVTVKTVAQNNAPGEKLDTLIISGLQVRINEVDYPVETARVPLKQTSLVADELIWSVMHNGQRYYIMAVSDKSTTSLQFRQFTQSGSSIYKLNTKTVLVKGSNDGDNTDGKYITPWTFAYNPKDAAQLSLKTEYGINHYLKMSGNTVGSTAGVHGTDSSFLTYHYVNVYTNDNANEEELVKLQFDADKWLQFDGESLKLVSSEEDASIFSWTYLVYEYNLQNNGTYPSHERVEFGYNTTPKVTINTKYKAYREYSMLLGNKLTYFGREESTHYKDYLENSPWLTTYTIDTIPDSRVDSTVKSIFTISFDMSNMTTSVTPKGASPIGVTYGGADKYIDIVDTLCVRLSLKGGAPAYRFKDKWSGFSSVSDGNLKIPLVRKTYHEAEYDSVFCTVPNDEVNIAFPATLIHTGDDKNDTILYKLSTMRRHGTRLQDVDGNMVVELSSTLSYVNAITEDANNKGMHLNNKDLAEVRLMDEYGNTPDWCKIIAKGDSTLVVQCTKDGVRSPRSAYLYFAYILTIDGNMRFVSYRITVSQDSHFDYENNQQLIHSKGASGDELNANGTQQVHENKRILYYYPDQDVELPIRERSFYGWWRWHREGYDEDSTDVSDQDIPDSLWRQAPQNTGKYDYPFRTIGEHDSVWIDPKDEDKGKRAPVTMGRYTVFHYKSKDYNNKADPPAKNPRVAPPTTIRKAGADYGKQATLTYVADISNYYDHLPMSLKYKNQVDTAALDTMQEIPEPTLSLREIFELRPWTEMAATMDRYKSHTTVNDEYPLADESYMEDHVVMAPLRTRLLLQTEQRYNLDNVTGKGHSESLLGYYMRDDNWSSMSAVKDAYGWSRQDSMIWCGGWDVDCLWFTYNPTTKKYSPCNHTVTADDDFLQVPEKNNIDTVYYCLRARSKKTTGTPGDDETTVDGDYWFNICRYKICYHHPNIYGPKQEVSRGKLGTKALISNDEIEQRYEVLERLNFDYLQPGSSYHVYPHPLPWADASYGYCYPETSDLPHNRYHNESDFPNHGEYGLVNRIPYSSYWHQMEQHGGAANGYMIYCDGMSSAGQVAALSLETHLCAGQKMFFSAYVGNPSNQKDKANPNFIFSVQGSINGTDWEDITTYMTGDIMPSNQWYQIYFPINHIRSAGSDYTYFRVRIYNVSSNWDGNDFIIDDMCIFATKPPLIAYQANTACKEEDDEKDTHVILRVDYQGITGDGYNGKKVYYTVKETTPEDAVRFVEMTDHYMDQEKHDGADASKPDTICGQIYIPQKNYNPQDDDSIFANVNQLLDRFEDTYKAHLENPANEIFREGYIYEILEGDIRPVKYTVHSAQMDSKNTYTVHMSGTYGELLNSICGMTSYLKVSNRMVLELNGMEEPHTELVGLCANETYDISLRVKGSLYLDSVAPIDLDGSCVNDWLLYGDTIDASSKLRYGYYYSDIKKIITEGLRIEPSYGTNKNQFAPSLSAIDKKELNHYVKDIKGLKQPGLDAYTMIADLVTNGFLTLYKSKITATVSTGDSIQYIILPIVGTGSDALNNANIEVCPAPIFVKLKAKNEGGLPLMVGGLHRDSTQMMLPVEVLATEHMANNAFKLRVDSIMSNVGIKSITLNSTNDPNFLEGIHTLGLVPNIDYPIDEKDYYHKTDSIELAPSPETNYRMKQGYSYTFYILLQNNLGKDTLDGGCAVGTVPFILSIQPDYLRWDPQSTQSNEWNNPDNWIGINQQNVPIHTEARFAPMEGTYVVIPQMTDGLPYPLLPQLPLAWKDSIQKVNFEYNNCNIIRFLPGAAMSQQQRMNYNDAVIDMSMPQQKWGFRSAPVTGMISGDIYMSNADLNWETSPWEVGTFDAAGRSYKTGNGSFWLSVFSRTTYHETEAYGDREERVAEADWSKVTNGLKLSLPAASGWAVYARTASGKDAVVRLPKNDDTYYYYGSYGETLYDRYEQYLRTFRTENAGGGTAGKLAFHPAGTFQNYALANEVANTTFAFGNPSMGYVDIWGFIDDNCLVEEFGYMDESGGASIYRTVSRATAMVSDDTISNPMRYLPPMHAIMVQKTGAATTSLSVVLNADRVLTDADQAVPSVHSCGEGGGDQESAHAPQRNETSRGRGIMTVTAQNPASPRCTSYLLIGQGYHDDIRSGEDAVLTTLNIDNFNMTSTPTTPFNIYALEERNALSIDLRNEIECISVSFYMSNVEFEPQTKLWFSGVNNIDGSLVFYDAQTRTERPIADGICITIETPEQNHQKRYYICRRGFEPDGGDDTTTGFEPTDNYEEQAVKFIQDDQVLILRNGQVFTIMGQKVR